MKHAAAATLRILLALWLGAGLAISFVAIPVVFDPATKAVVPNESVGFVAQGVLGRFFWVQLGLFGLAFIARLRAGAVWSRCERGAWIILGLGSLMAAFWLHPKLRELHHAKYDSAATAEVRATAAREFRGWHGGSQTGNLILLVTLGALVVGDAYRTRVDRRA